MVSVGIEDGNPILSPPIEFPTLKSCDPFGGLTVGPTVLNGDLGNPSPTGVEEEGLKQGKKDLPEVGSRDEWEREGSRKGTCGSIATTVETWGGSRHTRRRTPEATRWQRELTVALKERTSKSRQPRVQDVGPPDTPRFRQP